MNAALIVSALGLGQPCVKINNNRVYRWELIGEPLPDCIPSDATIESADDPGMFPTLIFVATWYVDGQRFGCHFTRKYQKVYE